MLDLDEMRTFYNQDVQRRDALKLRNWSATERRRFLDELKDVNAKTLLELGAGTGRDALFFQEQGLTVKALDLSSEMVKRCREKGLDAEVGNVLGLEPPPKPYDAIYSMNALLHVPKSDLDGVLASIKRMLKPQGLFYLGVHGGVDTEHLWRGEEGDKPPRFFSLHTDKALLDKVTKHFSLIYFRRVQTVNTPNWRSHYQSLILQNG